MARAAVKLSPDMTLEQFHNGYFYAVELRKFAQKLKIPDAGKLRKDELMSAIEEFLKTGKRACPTRRSLHPSGRKDSDRALHMDTPVVRYTNNSETKAFLLDQAQKIEPGFSIKSGARYRLNRWREDQMTKGRVITYGDLVHQLMEFSRPGEKTPRAKGTYYMYFLADYLADGAGNRAEGIKAWHQLKRMDIPKTYAAWKKAQSESQTQTI